MKKYFKYKGMTVNAFGIPTSKQGARKSTYNDTKVESNPKSHKVKHRSMYNKSFTSTLSESAPKNLIVMFDIPNTLKKERDWFRRQLINMNFKMIQKSVWVGPSPLPGEFLKYVKNLKMKSLFKTFKLSKPYDPSTSAYV